MTLGSLVRLPQPAGRVFRRDFDRLMDDLWGGFGLAPVAFAPQAGLTPSFDAVELENEYRVTADLPGVEPAELEVSVEDGVLTIKGRRHFEDEDESENQEGSVTRVEELGRFERRIRFPAEIVEDNVKASYKHGVLRVKIPKPEEIKPEVRSIPVETS